MNSAFRRLGRAAIEALADALRRGRMEPPYRAATMGQFAPRSERDAVVEALDDMHGRGMTPEHIAVALDLLAEERAASQALSDRIELVWSPPELDRVDGRDTAVVVQELFRSAVRSILIVSYVFDHGGKAEAIFGELAKRMEQEPHLQVQIVANIKREYGDGTAAMTLEREFAKRLREKIWPGGRLPEVYYYTRSLAEEVSEHAVLHAKAVVVDGVRLFVTSANFTEAAQRRNIEMGLLVDDVALAARVVRQFAKLREEGVLKRVNVEG